MVHRRVLIAAAAAAALASTGSLAAVGGEGAMASSAPLKVGLELTGPDNDNGYYQETATALKAAAAKVGAHVTIIQNVGFNPPDLITAVKNLALQGNQLVIVDGASGDAAAVVAKQFPKVQFVIHTAPPPKPLSNLHGYVPQQGETSYVVGALAAAMTKSHKAGFLGGGNDIPTSQANAGFAAGLATGSPRPTLQKTIVGTYSDPAKGSQAAAAQIANGADVLYAYLDAGFYGVVQAVKASHKNVKLFSATVLRCTLGSMVVGSAFDDNTIIMAQILQAYRSGTLPKGTKYYGLQNAAIQRVALCPKYNTAANRAIVSRVTSQIRSGKIKLGTAITGT